MCVAHGIEPGLRRRMATSDSATQRRWGMVCMRAHDTFRWCGGGGGGGCGCGVCGGGGGGGGGDDGGGGGEVGLRTLPDGTRARIAKSLRMLRDKQIENPWKKHGNIPL